MKVSITDEGDVLFSSFDLMASVIVLTNGVRYWHADLISTCGCLTGSSVSTRINNLLHY